MHAVVLSQHITTVVFATTACAGSRPARQAPAAAGSSISCTLWVSLCQPCRRVELSFTRALQDTPPPVHYLVKVGDSQATRIACDWPSQAAWSVVDVSQWVSRLVQDGVVAAPTPGLRTVRLFVCDAAAFGDSRGGGAAALDAFLAHAQRNAVELTSFDS